MNTNTTLLILTEVKYALTLLTNYFCSLYIFIRVSKIKLNPSKKLYISFLTVIITCICTFLRIVNFSYYGFIFLLLTILSFFFLKKDKYYITLSTIIISIGISFCLEILSLCVLVSIFVAIGYYNVDLFTEFISVILQFTLVFFFMKIKRIKNGFAFFENKNNFGVSLLISGPLIILISLQKTQIPNTILTIVGIGLLISTLGLLIWIRSAITHHYRNRLKKRAEEYNQNELLEKDKEIEKLTNEISSLSSIVHRDNHLMSSLETIINDLKNNPDELHKQKLFDELLTLAKERNGFINDKMINDKILPSTGNGIIDGALGNMYIKSAARNIDYNLAVSCDINYLINNLISQTNLETLLCDHIKDAIIAIENNPGISGKILISITMTNDIYEISIMDNGIPFEIETLKKLGLERITTHKDSGGSGIGFMTTFETLNNSGASLIITEYETPTPFLKSITFRFDGLNKFTLKSYRKNELDKMIDRDDLTIMEN